VRVDPDSPLGRAMAEAHAQGGVVVSLEAGTIFRRVTGSYCERYLVNAVACECPDYQEAGNICKHVRAIVLSEQRQQSAKAAPSPSSRHTTHRPCRRRACGAILPPEWPYTFCGHCWERKRDILANV
jgi:hypothetical protein